MYLTRRNKRSVALSPDESVSNTRYPVSDAVVVQPKSTFNCCSDASIAPCSNATSDRPANTATIERPSIPLVHARCILHPNLVKYDAAQLLFSVGPLAAATRDSVPNASTIDVLSL